MKPPSAPLTTYICDLIDCQMGKISANDIRERWKAGRYAGVSKEAGAAYAKLHGIARTGG